MSVQISSASKEYVRALVSSVLNGAAHDPTGDVVTMAFTPLSSGNDTTGASWVAASWETVSGSYYARCLVGPGGGVTTLTAGDYSVWVKITDSPEVPIKKAGTITVI